MRKGQKMTTESRQKLSNSLKGRKVWNTGTKGVMKPNSTSFKIGEHRSFKTEFKNGNIPWTKGKHPKIKHDGQFKKGHIPWIKGKKSIKDPLKTYDTKIKRIFGISLNDYNELLKKQNEVCAICGNKEKNGKKLSIDHCHATKKVRGLLCGSCNRALGLLKDNTLFLQKAIEYLIK